MDSGPAIGGTSRPSFRQPPYLWGDLGLTPVGKNPTSVAARADDGELIPLSFPVLLGRALTLPSRTNAEQRGFAPPQQV